MARGVYRRTSHRVRTRARRWVSTGTAAPLTDVYPDPGDVRSGVEYGPNGNDYTGTYAASGGGRVFGSSVFGRS